MKKTLFFLTVLSVITTNAQLQPVLKNKRGINILPKQGDFALGFSANPFLSYAGNFFNNSTSNNSPFIDLAGRNQTVFAKYMKTDELAYRASFRFGLQNNTSTFSVADASPGAPINSMVLDVMKQKYMDLGLSGGFEKRRGNTRLQGLYGAEAFILYSSGATVNYEYGNKIEHLFAGTSRITKRWGSSQISVGVRGFAGIEYFLAPKISLGAEFGFGPSFNSRGAVEQNVESYDFNNNKVVEDRYKLSAKTRDVTISLDNADGIIRLLFYF